MKRTNVVLDEQMLAEAVRISGERTYSAAIDRALREMVQRIRARGILSLQGSGLWEGDLSEMRGDTPPAVAARRTSGRRSAPVAHSSYIADSPLGEPVPGKAPERRTASKRPRGRTAR